MADGTPSSTVIWVTVPGFISDQPCAWSLLACPDSFTWRERTFARRLPVTASFARPAASPMPCG
jgi:hypothetical protein